MRRLLCLTCWVASVFFYQPVLTQNINAEPQPEAVIFQSGELQLRGLLWLPPGDGPFPAVIYNHGSEAHPERFIMQLPLAFLDHGYAFFCPFRRGQGFSIGQGRYIIEQMDSASKVGGFSSRLAVTIRLHETSQLQDQMAALSFLKSHPRIDPEKIAVFGHSFGGIQALLIAREPVGVKAAVSFAGAAMMWGKSPQVGKWMKGIARDARIPVYFIQAENDFTTKPSLQLSAEMKKLGKPAQVKIYPRRGTTSQQGHNFVQDTRSWSPDVYPWLDSLVGKK